MLKEWIPCDWVRILWIIENVLYFHSTGGSPFYSFRDVFGMSIPKSRGKNQYLHFTFRCVMHCLDWFGLVFMGYNFTQLIRICILLY